MRAWTKRLALCLLAAAVLALSVPAGSAPDEGEPVPAPGGEAVAVRADNLTVTPSTGPVTHVAVRNLRNAAFEGTLRVTFPDGWRVERTERAISLGPWETQRVPFAIVKAVDVAANTYAYEITVTGGGTTLVSRQNVACTSAPYLKPTIDGDLTEWRDSIPVTFSTGGARTVVRTCWNRRNFCLAVEVTEAKLVGYSAKAPGGEIDAVQFALATRGATTAASEIEPARRYEFLVAAGGEKAVRFQLIAPGEKLSTTRQVRSLDALASEKVRAAVSRADGVTRYEIAVPFALLPQLRPTTGRELSFSLLVHDPDGVGLRDLGEVMRLPPERRQPLAWCRWRGAKWPKAIPFDGKIEWGLCSSIH